MGVGRGGVGAGAGSDCPCQDAYCAVECSLCVSLRAFVCVLRAFLCAPPRWVWCCGCRSSRVHLGLEEERIGERGTSERARARSLFSQGKELRNRRFLRAIFAKCQNEALNTE